MSKPTKPVKRSPIRPPVSNELSPLEQAVWAAEFVHFRGERMAATKRFPPDQDDIEDAILDANDVVDELRAARERK
jgi:hypothetical protein